MSKRPRPNTALRLAFRLPVHLYRLRLGWLFGHRLLLLTHRGRKSGRIYQSVLEVVRYDPATRESVVVSAWGERSDWYRNLRETSAIEVRTGREHYAPAQQFLHRGEVYAVVADYERRHPFFSRVISRLLDRPLDGTEAARRGFASCLRMIAFSPRHEPEAGRAGDPRSGER